MKRRPSPISRLSLLTAFLFFTLPAIICSQPLLRDSLDLVTFLDGLMEAHLEQAHIAGATVSVVQNGRLLFAKGYGYADLEKRQPVEPEKTLFRVGSITKLFFLNWSKQVNSTWKPNSTTTWGVVCRCRKHTSSPSP